MNRKDFKNLLDKVGCFYHEEGDWLVLKGDMRGDVRLDHNNFTSLPENLKFENGGVVRLDYNGLTSLPDNIKFENGGGVGLDHNNLTSLPKNLKFENGGDVWLEHNSLTSLPYNLKFENSGCVWLDHNNLTSLPENIGFENGGSVYLTKNNSNSFRYQGKVVEIVDEFTMLILSSKVLSGLTIKKAHRFHGDNFKGEHEIAYIAQKDGLSAHGASVKEAVEDLEFKRLERDLPAVVKDIKARGYVTVQDYRLLTGACREGIRVFLEEKDVKVDKMSIAEALELTEGAYGHEKFKKALGGNYDQRTMPIL